MALVDFMIPIAINFYFLRKMTTISIINWLVSTVIVLCYILLCLYSTTIIYSAKTALIVKSKSDFESLTELEKMKIKRFQEWMKTRDNLKDTLEFPYKYIPEITGLGEFLCCFFLVFGYSHFLL